MAESSARDLEPEASSCRVRTKMAPAGLVSSYAAMGLLKDNLQAASNRKQLSNNTNSNKASSDHDGRLLADESSSCKLSNLKSDLQQRAGPSRENALLRAELEVLRQQNQDLANKLQLAETKLGQHSRHLRQSHSGLQQELGSLKDALQSADAEKASAVSVTESAFAQLEAIRQTLDEVLLPPAEVEAAALKCCWLARHWELAHRLGIYPEVASGQAAYWRALSPPPDAPLQSARHIQQLLQQSSAHAAVPAACSGEAPVAPGPAGSSARSGSSSSGSSCRSEGHDRGPEWLRQGAGRFCSSMAASAADLVEIERGARQLQELGVEAAVMAALAGQAAARRSAGSLLLTLPGQAPAASAAGGSGAAGGVGGGGVPVCLSADEADQVSAGAAHLVFLWGRAALLGVEAQVAYERAEHWWGRLQGERLTLNDPQDLHLAHQELRMLGVEQQLWQRRHCAEQQPSGGISSLVMQKLQEKSSAAASEAAVVKPVVAGALLEGGTAGHDAAATTDVLMAPPAIVPLEQQQQQRQQSAGAAGTTWSISAAKAKPVLRTQ